MRRLAPALVVAVLLAQPAGAQAGRTAVASGTPFAGPVLAGAQVVYAREDAQGRAELRTPERSLHDFGAIPRSDPDEDCCASSYGAGISASATHVAAVWEAFQTVKGQVAGAFTTTVAGPLDGTIGPLASCSPFSIPPPDSADVDGTRVAFTTDQCNSGANHRLVVRDLATGSDVATIAAPAGKRLSNVRLAGRFLAWVEGPPYSGGDLVVYDLTAAAESYRVPSVALYSLQPDGKVVRIAPRPGGLNECGGQLAWHSPADPAIHALGGCPRFAPVLAGDRVLFVDVESSDLRIVSLTGASPAQALVDAPNLGVLSGDIDFDGTRATYAVAGCLPQLGQIYVDDLSGPTVLDDARCPLAAGGAVRFRRHPVRDGQRPDPADELRAPLPEDAPEPAGAGDGERAPARRTDRGDPAGPDAQALARVTQQRLRPPAQRRSRERGGESAAQWARMWQEDAVPPCAGGRPALPASAGTGSGGWPSWRCSA